MVSPHGNPSMLTLGGGILGTAIGLAVQASDLDGVGVEIAAWSAVGVGLSLILFGVHRLHAARRGNPHGGHSGRAAPVPLSERLLRLGQSMLDFVDERGAWAPVAPTSRPSLLLHPVQASQERRAQQAAARGYERDTLSIYSRRFAVAVRAAVQELLEAGEVAEHEARFLLSPPDVRTIQRVASRLIDLGTNLGRGVT